MTDPIRVLLADDHAVVRADDIEVVAEAENGAAAQDLVERDQPDVTVLDMQMTKASGISGQSTTPLVEPLTARELEVLTLTGKGYTNKATGVQLGISSRTAQGHLVCIFEKLQATSRTGAMMRAVSLGWLPPNLGELDSQPCIDLWRDFDGACPCNSSILALPQATCSATCTAPHAVRCK